MLNWMRVIGPAFTRVPELENWSFLRAARKSTSAASNVAMDMLCPFLGDIGSELSMCEIHLDG